MVLYGPKVLANALAECRVRKGGALLKTAQGLVMSDRGRIPIRMLACLLDYNSLAAAGLANLLGLAEQRPLT